GRPTQSRRRRCVEDAMAKGDISFATFNLFNLNLAGKPLYDGAGWTKEEFARKIAWTAAMVRRLEADVIGFQELWHGDCLEEVFTKAELLDQFDLLVPTFADGKRIVCAAGVRKGLLEGQPQWLADFPDKFKLQ